MLQDGSIVGVGSSNPLLAGEQQMATAATTVAIAQQQQQQQRIRSKAPMTMASRSGRATNTLPHHHQVTYMRNELKEMHTAELGLIKENTYRHDMR